MSLRDITADDIESLAVGAWVLGTGGGGNPYLPLLNMRALYKEGHRVQLMQAVDLADGDPLVAEPCAHTFGRGEHFLGPRVVDNADNQIAGDHQAD